MGKMNEYWILTNSKRKKRICQVLEWVEDQG